MRPIRTLFVSTTLALGGAERVVEELITRLDRERFDVEALTLRDPGRVGASIAASGIPVRHGLTGPGKLDPLLIPRVRALLRERGDEVLYFLDHPHAIFHGMLASAATPVRVRVMPVHTTGRWGGQASVPRSVRLFLPWLDAVIAIAQAQRTYLIEKEGIPARKIVVIPNGIAADLPDAEERAARRRETRRELGVSPEAKVVMILAVLRPEKNHELLLQAAARIRERFPGLVLLVVGDGPRRDFLEAETDRLGMGAHVRFLGHRSDGRRLWAAADLAVLCS
ncbi:MAG: glycosyltransferase, partial [Candidatus Eisenbacteria bacterium]|nr:glycosyltransferase [Candidatus Latescibacterota bacterium]MBD3302001.1 glycosyltransferase [Candidatus Eisenbacteria bacterium]